jgi:amino acid adenylation domain-containing protein/non-ribosomal peptide synthase protein (TIGR01720 family)
MSDWHAANVASTFTKVLESLVEAGDGDTSVGKLKTFSELDKRQVLEWNKALPEAINSCVHEVVATQATARPEAAAVCSWDVDFSYRELEDISTRLGCHLRGLGVGPEVLVPLCFEKSAWAIVAMMAVLKAGGACVSLDPSHPLSRLEGIVHDVKARLVLATAYTSARFEPMVNDVLVINRSFLASLPLTCEMSPYAHVRPTNPAFVIYTSGSTGKPKGVVIEHRSVCTSVEAHGVALDIGPCSRVLQFAAYVFDISIQDIFTTLMRGGCVCVPSEHDRVNDLSGTINRMKVNWACITPTVASLLRPSDVPGLRTLTLAGEAVTKKVTDIWGDAGLESFNNCYGPAESTIYCAWNGMVGKTCAPSNIGQGLASLLWVVDPIDHDQLVSVGRIGELLLEGPLLARGYLNDMEKTVASFIHDPAWAKANGSGQSRRMYKTGDLVRYNSDSTLDYLGRKDSQVKMHGQRIELGEIEYHLVADEEVENAMMMMPMTGHYQGRLVAITAIRELESNTTSITSDGGLQVLNKARMENITPQMSRVRQRLATQLPVYMMPSAWILVEAIPLNTSGKLDRATVSRWLLAMDDTTYRQIAEAEVGENVDPMTKMDCRLQKVLSRVLNLPLDQVAPNRSFLSLGGDSIIAMQVVSRARLDGMVIRVQDILQSKSISELALVTKNTSSSWASREDELDTMFDLSPIQQMYFNMAGQTANRFNQSFFLRLTRETRPQDVARAIEAVVRQHSMLRARFVKAQDEQWSQLITKDIAGSHRFTLYDGINEEKMVAIMAASEDVLDVKNGPLFSADMFNCQNNGQLLFMVAHHLIIDLVSWRIILQDLEEVVQSGRLSAEAPLSFQVWCKSQAEYAQTQLVPEKVLPFEVTSADYAYWGMEDKLNTYGDTASESFTIDIDTTAALLGSANEPLRTEPVELFIATLLLAFSQTFKDRSSPTVYSEGHGREPWDTDVDLSGTVGWFTTISPLHLSIAEDSGFLETLKRTKDTRRNLPSNGWPYFASRFLNAEGIEAFSDHMPMEVLFNYLGRYQQLERDESLLRQEPLPESCSISDVGQDVQRLALFEVSVSVIRGIAQFSISYNRHMQRQNDVGRWILAWKASLIEAVATLANTEVDYTLSDFPLLSLTYTGLVKLKNERLPELGITSFTDIEDVYSCSPMQQGLLLSQSTNAGSYEVAFTFEVIPSVARNPVDVEELASAWQQVVDRHAALRTVFVASVSEDGVFDQIVLKRISARIEILKATGEETSALTALGEQSPINHREVQPPHRFTICQAAIGRVFCKLEINHALIDAESVSLLQHDLTLAYERTLPIGPAPLYSEYIKYLGERPLHVAIDYWKGYLHNVEPCNFPVVQPELDEVKELRSFDVEFDLPEGLLQIFCEHNQVTVANLAQTVWGLVLRCYTGSDQVCFGYLASGRDVAVKGIEAIIGPFINMLVCRINASGTSHVGPLVEQVQIDYLAGLDHQHCSLAQMQHALNLSGRPLFNTLMSVQRASSSPNGQGKISDPSAISFKSIESHDPTEVSRIKLDFDDTMLTGTIV